MVPHIVETGRAAGKYRRVLDTNGGIHGYTVMHCTREARNMTASTTTTIPLRRSGVRYQHWRDSAACRDADPEIFFPEAGGTSGRRGSAAADAKLICARCPVRAECLGHAVAFPEKHGVWGALAERERYGMRPSQQAPTPKKAAA